ncbi:hypothetical protein NHH73_07000 [Oxalobacteraceae bacterium OTU3CINTB1]|nr:hypothetical protein NHH73_07000 [Oxalobacteraceae bacterium OTU3CINTB1]
MFPISSTTLSGPNPANFPLVSPAASVDAVNSSTIAPVGSALDAPAQASVQVDLSPVANFLLTVSQSREQIAQLQTAVANGADPQEAAARAATLNDATQNVVNAFNLLPSVDFNQAQPQGPSLLNNLVDSLNRQTFGSEAARQLNQANQPNQPQSAAQSLAQSLSRIGVTLQPPLLSDAAAGLSLDNEILRASFNTDNQSTTNTLQNTLDTFSELATRFAEQLSAAGSGALPALASAQQNALTPEDLVANARLDLARAELDLLRQIPLPDTAADRLAAQRADLEQPLAPRATAPDSPIVNPLQASTAEVIAAQNAEAREAIARQTNAQAADTQEANIDALPSQQSQTAQSLQAADQAERNQVTAANTAQENQAAANANTERSAAQAASDAAQATAAAQAARQQAASGLSAASAASTQAAAQANAAQNAAAAAAAANSTNATAEQQAVAAQNAATNLAAANAAAASALAQAQAAQSAADALAAQSAEASALAAQARAALAAATSPEAANAAGAIAAQQAAAAQTTASNLAAANAAAADAQQQARAAQVAAVQASTVQTNPLQGNPALAAAIAAYNITDPALLGANARATQSAVSAVPRVSAVSAPARARGIGPGQ